MIGHLLAWALANLDYDRANWPLIARSISRKCSTPDEMIVRAEALRAIAAQLRRTADELLD